ncbi:MAG: 4-(cytidine 5'-diphospho)-2-C-methyl-D-erythritol kinase [Ginsengibacter sp.]
MIAFPNCKINLGLNILEKKADGFHDLETVFFPVNIHDVLEILEFGGNTTQVTTSGISLGECENNICLEAYNLLKKDYPDLPGIKMHLHKAIPLGAGLGGGSADGVATLKLLNKTFNLNIPDEQLFAYALKLGSDCPFFILNKPCFASGRGETLEPISLPLYAHKIVIVNPGIHVNTTEAFKHIVPHVPEKRIKEIIAQPIDTWKNELVNDFEDSVFKKYPDVHKIKKDLYDSGAIYSGMSGSGSTVYGIFKDGTLTNYIPHADYFYKIVEAA